MHVSVVLQKVGDWSSFGLYLIFAAAGKGDNSTILIAIPIAAVGVLTILVIVILVVYHRRRWVVQNQSIAKT